MRRAADQDAISTAARSSADNVDVARGSADEGIAGRGRWAESGAICEWGECRQVSAAPRALRDGPGETLRVCSALGSLVCGQ